MAKQKNNEKSDYMSDKMDEQLEQLEDRISILYANASYEVNQEWTKFTDTFKEKDSEKQAQLEAGEITQAEYTLWRNKNVLQTDLYKSTVSSMTDILTKSDITAMAMVNDEMPIVVAESYNFVQALGWKSADEAGMSVGTFQIYNADSVQKIVRDNPDLLKSVDVPEDKKWNKDHINREITTGIIKGESLPKVADRLSRVTDMDKNSATRNARTAMTYAENLGRSESAEQLKEMGIPEEEVWSATYDDKVRDTHLLLDGTKRDEDGYFGAGILATPLRCPADPSGDPEEIYNCRCRLNIVLKGIDHSQDDDLYEKFMQENYPEDWKALQESESYQNKQEQRYDAIQRKADLEADRRASEASEASTSEITSKDAQEATQGKSEASEGTSDKTMIPEKPERPKKDDFDTDEAYQEAKEQYQEAKAEYEKGKEEYIENLANNTEPMSRAEFAQWTESHNVGIIENLDWDNIKSIDDADPKLLRLLTERYDELFEQFPSVLTYRQDFMEKMGESGTYKFEIGYSTNGYGAEASHGFVFGRGGNDFNLFVGDHYDGIASGRFTNAEDALNHIFDHEFGHNVQSTIATYSGMNESEVGFKFYEMASKAEGISEYATTNEDEFFAEAFATWAGGSDTELAKYMEEFLKEYKLL